MTEHKHTERDQRIEQYVVEYIAQKQLGDSITKQKYESLYPDLMPDLAEKLRLAELVILAAEHTKTRRSDSQPADVRDATPLDSPSGPTKPPPSYPVGSLDDTPPRAETTAMNTLIVCPDCQAEMRTTESTDSHGVACSTCGSAYEVDPPDDTVSGLVPGKSVGRFELIAVIGKGGFGTVWRARDPHLDREVALKVPRCGNLDAEQAEWFLREARNAAQIRHPNIVSIHEVGRDGDHIYLVSDLIEGETLTERLVRQPLTLQQAADLTRIIAQAIEHIHLSEIVHRDLKSSNILLDEQGVPHVADFGMARRQTNDVTLTMNGKIVGTPGYMSPEQARGDSHTADARSDIYSLGVLLFEMITGELPFRGLPHAMFNQIVNDDPPRPRRLNPLVPRDLETICLKCLEKRPEKRFASAAELACELERFQRGEPIHSRAISGIERVWRWSHRRPFAAALAGLICLISVVAPAAAFRFAAVAGSARQSQRATAESEHEKSELLYSFQMRAVQSAMKETTQPDIVRAGQLLDQQIPKAGEPDLRDFEWYYWQEQRHRGLLWERKVPRPKSLAASPDGKWLAIGSATGFVRIEELSSGESFDLFPSLQSEDRTVGVYCVAFSPDSRLVAFGTGDLHSVVDVFELASRERIVSLTPQGMWVHTLEFSPDGQVLAIGTVNQATLEFWTALDPKSHRVMKVTEGSVIALAFSNRGDKLALDIEQYGGKGRGEIRVIDVRTQETLSHRARAGDHHDLGRWTDDDRQLVCFRNKGFVVERLSVDELKLELPKYEVDSLSRIGTLAVSPDQHQLVAGGYDGTLVAWDMESGIIKATWPGHLKTVLDVIFLPDGKRMVTSGQDGLVRCWSTEHERDEFLPLQLSVRIVDTCFSPDSNVLFALSSMPESASELLAWNVSQQEPVWEKTFPDDVLTDICVASDGMSLIAASNHGLIRRIDARSGDVLGELQLFPAAPDSVVQRIAISLDGTKLIAGQAPAVTAPISGESLQELVLVDLEQNQVLNRWPAHNRLVGVVAFGPHPGEVSSTGYDKVVRRWNFSTAQLIAEYPLGQRVGHNLHFIDDETLAAIDHDGTIWRWSLDDHRRLPLIGQRAGMSRWSALSPSGRTLAVPLGSSQHEGTPGQIRLFDTRTWEIKTTFVTPSTPDACSFSPNGLYLSAGDIDGRVYLWRAD